MSAMDGRPATAPPDTESARAELDRASRRSEMVFLGFVEALGAAPPCWTGLLASFQEVTYRVDEVLAGESAETGIVVRHLVVRNSPTAEPGDSPGLSAELFSRGALLLVMAIRDRAGRWVSTSERFGALPASTEAVAQVRGALAAAPAVPGGPAKE